MNKKKLNPRIERLKAEKQAKKDFFERKRIEGDNSINSRLQYRASGVAKLNRSVNKYGNLSAPASKAYWKKRKEFRAKFRVDDNHKVIQEGRDYIHLRKGSLQQVISEDTKLMERIFGV